VQLQHQVPGKVPEGSGGFRCRYLFRFWRVPVQIPGEALEGSVQIPGEVPEGSGADSR